MTSEIDGIFRHDHQVEGPRRDGMFTPRAEIFLGGSVRLHRCDGHPEKIAHASAATATIRPATSMTMSARLFSESRNGLKPMPER